MCDPSGIDGTSKVTYFIEYREEEIIEHQILHVLDISLKGTNMRWSVTCLLETKTWS